MVTGGEETHQLTLLLDAPRQDSFKWAGWHGMGSMPADPPVEPTGPNGPWEFRPVGPLLTLLHLPVHVSIAGAGPDWNR